MTLKNEIFEGLGAATAAQKLVNNPQDDYYEQIADAAKRENARRRKQDAEVDQASDAAKAKGVPAAAPAGAGVPTAASSATPNMPTVPGVPAVAPPPQQQAMGTGFPTTDAGYGTSYPPALVAPRVARGGRIKQAINLRFRAGGAVTPGAPSDEPEDDDEEGPSIEYHGYGTDYGTPRHPHPYRPYYGPRKEEPAWIQRNDDSAYGYGDENIDPDPGVEEPTQARARRYAEGGTVEEESPADKLVREFLSHSGADVLLDNQRRYMMQNTAGVRDFDNTPTSQPLTESQQRVADESKPNQRARSGSLPPRRQVTPTPPSPDDVERANYETGANTRERQGVLPVAPTQSTVEGSPVIPSYQPRPLGGTDTTGVEGSPNIVPPLSRYTPPRVGGEDTPTTPGWPTPPPPPVTRDDSPRFVDETVNRPKPVFDPRPYGREFNASDPIQADEAQALRPVTPSAPGFDGAQPYAPIDPSTTVGSAVRSLFPPTSTPAPPVPPPVGAGAGTASGPQVAAAAPGQHGPSGTASSAPPPPPGSTTPNAPSRADKGYQTFEPTERMAMRPDLPNWNPLGMDLRAPARAAGGGGGGGASTAPPPRLGMSDPNRVAAFDPTPGGADLSDPTRRNTTGEIANMLVGASTQGKLGPNGELPPVGDGAVNRKIGMGLISAFNNSGKFEPGEALMAGMLASYKVLLSQGRVDDANKMAYGLMQFANLEASAHGHVAADRVQAGDFRGALREVAAAATWLPDGMKHSVSPDGRSMVTSDANGKVTAVTPVDGRWLLAAIGGFKNGDLLWNTLQAAADHLKATDKNAEGRALGHEIQRNTIALQRQRLGKGAAGPKGPAMPSDSERRAAEIAGNLSGRPRLPTTPRVPSGGGEQEVDPASQYSPGYDYTLEEAR